MMSTAEITARGQEMLRETLLKELTGSLSAEALLKEHYDNLQDLTNISKKTLKRFFREKVQVGPQTRNLLAAIALGKKHELEAIDLKNQDYYLTFLESISANNTNLVHNDVHLDSIWEFGRAMASQYEQARKAHEYMPLHCWRRRLLRDNSLGSRYQEISLNRKLINNHSRALVIGEAGMGKSAFARELCLDWCDAGELDHNIPIYIDLRSELYTRHDNSIVSYILKSYFDEDMDWMVLDFLEKHADSYCLLLDGFDDLTQKEKEVLMREVHSFSAHIQLVILSRDYGFNDYNFPARAIYEIAGLNIKAQESLVNHLLPGTHTALKYASLMTFIHSNPFLSIMSRSPLRLSQIVALITTERSYGLLENVRSSADLQAVFDQYAGKV